ncbi:MAG: zinc-ribbon domain-containing protein [Sulfitobacter sp.]
MRLICPNCDAQYEVPDDVMPTAGRDVQCSNCGQTWFQHHPDHTPNDDIGASDDHAPDEETAPPPPPPPPAEPERKQLDPAVADILRQEAEAEQAARRTAQSGGLESQPDLGMDLEDTSPEDDTDRRAREARERMARLRGNDSTEIQAAGGSGAVTDTTSAALGSRRDLLPDIDEINSTLRSGSARSGSGAADVEPEIEAPTRQRKRRGFRTGFLTVLLIFIVLAAVYVLAPRLADAVPALKSPLQSYGSIVDQGRGWLDIKLQSMLKSLDSAAEESR